MKKSLINTGFFFFVLLIVILSVWGPEQISLYKDRSMLGFIHQQEVELAAEGYRYELSSSEKLFIFSKARNSHTLSDGDLNVMLPNFSEEELGSYAFIVNHKGSSEKEISDQEVYEICNKGMNTLKEAGILPEGVQNVEAGIYDAVLYSAIDAREPRNNVAVWKLSLSANLRNIKKENRLIDAYIDADTGKFYEFYARTDRTWEEFNPDRIVAAWSQYMNLPFPKTYESANPLMETTPYFKKYICSGPGEEQNILTVGYYEGIQELFLVVSPGS